jgi:predicted dinucleotide-binding enzyme
MRIGLVGAGSLGGALGDRLASSGHEIMYGGGASANDTAAQQRSVSSRNASSSPARARLNAPSDTGESPHRLLPRLVAGYASIRARKAAAVPFCPSAVSQRAGTRTCTRQAHDRRQTR